ncbi:MAG: UDP-N-acetylmuramoyl-L-alanine--D-glutamate ligase [Elusimicrobiota bacterium]|jgi:UDP-N-acetylmuramoylalanine--D-glutamate ligase|nr:UDP-N-acetylmuramoyl-L-alanine--D-glutamate ligase [Elusimicrobiota bacterium]
MKKIKKISVLGLGKSGTAAANLAVKLKYNVLASDAGAEREIKGLDKKVKLEFNGHSENVLDADFIVKSPGIHRDINIIKKAQKRKIPIISELRFALDHSKFKMLIAVTGTNGKTTVTDLISKIIKKRCKHSFAAGNIGCPLSKKVLQTSRDTVITAEVSSYQLEDTPNFHCRIAVLLNITPDHLEHHKTFSNYIRAKKNICINQKNTDFAIANYDDKICRRLAQESKGAKVFFSLRSLKEGVYFEDGKIIFKFKNKEQSINPKIRLAGKHNISNILAACAAAFCASIDLKTIENTISSYKGMPHRIEFVKKINGADFYNDSKSTNVDSTKTALEAFEGNIILIMGGRDKGFPYTPLKELIKEKVKAALLIGEAAEKIKSDLSEISFIDCGDLKNAFQKAADLSKEGDIVLLSPGCASFDQFKNFEERGDFFKSLALSRKS